MLLLKLKILIHDEIIRKKQEKKYFSDSPAQKSQVINSSLIIMEGM